jgi:hypothetical protein
MIGVVIAIAVCTIFLAVLIAGETNIIKKFVADSMCELMTAVFNAEAIKAKCEEAARNGQQYVDISEVAK